MWSYDVKLVKSLHSICVKASKKIELKLFEASTTCVQVKIKF